LIFDSFFFANIATERSGLYRPGPGV